MGGGGERMKESDFVPERRPDGRSAGRASGDHWRTRGGLFLVVALTVCSAVVVVLLAGRGAAAAVAALRGPVAAGPTATQSAPAVNTPVAPAQSTPEQSARATPQVSPTSAPQPTLQPTPQATTQQTVSAPTAAAQRREHTVAAGDTLSAIAQRYGTTVDALVAANRLPNRNATLQIGQRLVVPD